jgi:predicted metalloprotease with PDZ domain
MQVPSGNQPIEIQLPVWNALYQVRDFSQYVGEIKARDEQGHSLGVGQIEKSRWRIAPAPEIVVDYDIFADLAGPYGAQLNDDHAFFNLAEILMFTPETRSLPVRIAFTDVPVLWQIATALPSSDPGAGASATFTARNYDELVDSPFEIGRFRETSFHVNGAEYRIAIHANPADYNLDDIQRMVEKIVSAEVVWMNDQPFKSYLFIYHFPHVRSDGGMEHAHSTAIDENVERMKEDPLSLAGVTAHEFFHLWNVKRIRPQSLEPVDYMRENYTTALWFSEGVTSTVDAYMLLRAGLTDERIYLRHLAEEIRMLQSRASHRTQSAEESSLDAWLEKYLYYKLPDRSISYYNKGEILGVLLDLEVREASHGHASLRDVMQWMNQHYAKEGKFFPDSAGVQTAAEAVSGAKLEKFFRDYVAGTREIPYDDFLNTAGLTLSRRKVTVGDAGFTAVQSFRAAPIVEEVQAGSGAYQAGLEVGDVVVEVNGKSPSANFASEVEALEPGTALRLKVVGRRGERELEWNTGFKDEEYFTIEGLADATPQQLARRTAWLKGEDEPAEKPRRKSAHAGADKSSARP